MPKRTNQSTISLVELASRTKGQESFGPVLLRDIPERRIEMTAMLRRE
jgi:hypothetical protein